jgi:hypothetical protein
VSTAGIDIYKFQKDESISKVLPRLDPMALTNYQVRVRTVNKTLAAVITVLSTLPKDETKVLAARISAKEDPFTDAELRELGQSQSQIDQYNAKIRALDALKPFTEEEYEARRLLLPVPPVSGEMPLQMNEKMQQLRLKINPEIAQLIFKPSSSSGGKRRKTRKHKRKTRKHKSTRKIRKNKNKKH